MERKLTVGFYTVYTAGPMQFHECLNFPLFDSLRDHLLSIPWAVISPADQDRELIQRNLGVLYRPEDLPGYAEGDWGPYAKAAKFDYDSLLGLDFTRIINECQGSVFLPGWEDSVGAKAERFVSERTNKDIWLAEQEPWGWNIRQDPMPKRMSLSVLPAFVSM